MDLRAAGRKPIFCIYHGNCADGFGAAWVVRHALGADNVEFHAGVYGEPVPDVTGRDVVMVDFSYKRPVLDAMAVDARTILILDHHKTAVEDLSGFPTVSGRYSPEAMLAYKDEVRAPVAVHAIFDMERSGAGLAWDFFHPGAERPALINHIEDRDLWRFALPLTREIQAAVFSYPYDFEVWDGLVDQAERNPAFLAQEGIAIERKHFKDIDELLKALQREMVIGGIVVPVANLPYTLASDAGNLMAKRHPSRIGVCYWDTPNNRVFSLRSLADGPDVSAIASAYGGGGHAHASGFRMPIGWEGGGGTGRAEGADSAKEPTWGWWASRDGERYTVGPESSRGAVIKAAMTDFYGEPFFIVEATQGHISFNVFHHVIDWIDDDNCEASDPEGDPWSVAAGVTPSQERDLHYRLAETAARWAHDHGLSVSAWRFSETRNAERIDLTTLEAAGITSTSAAGREPQPSDAAPSNTEQRVMQTDEGS